MSTRPLLELKNIETYYGPIMAVRGVSLEVQRGQIVTLLGANGAGKTTLLKTISGIIEPQKGSVRLDGQEIRNLEPDHIARLGIGHVPEGREIFPFLTVEENLQTGAFNRRDGEISQDLEQIYDYFPVLKEKKTQPGGLLSGGQQQMLAIGRALMSRPSIMLLDEPSLGLAPKLVTEIAGIVKHLNQERGVTVLLVEQNAEMALNLADFVYVMEIGRVVMEGSSEQLRHATDIQEFYLGQKDQGVRGRRRWKQRKTWR